MLFGLRFGSAQAAHDLLHHVRLHVAVQQHVFRFLCQHLAFDEGDVARELDFVGGYEETGGPLPAIAQ